MNANTVKLALALGFFAVTGAKAAVTNTVTQSADLVFAEPAASVTLSLTPVSGLTAGAVSDGTVLVNGNIGLSNQQAYSALRFTYSSSGSLSGVGAIDVVGQATTSLLSLKLPADFVPAADGDNWLTNGIAGDQAFTIVANGNQDVVADTYTVIMEAGIYTA